MRSAGWTPVASDDTYQYSATALSVFWPEPEYRAVIARWPHLSAHLGATWDEHRQRTERHCALMDRAELRINQLPADVSSFEQFLAAKGVRSPSEEDLLAYPDMWTVTTAMAPWPPARSAACWCGSGRKYKQCCRPHGLGTLD
jgi:uncharacterized protein YchJ